MKVYHGTTEIRLKSILNKGIRPRGRDDGNWEEQPSRNDLVYLSTTYPLYFAATSVKGYERIAILEIDLEELNARKFLPDEDFVAYYLHKERDITFDEAVEHARNNLEEYKELWPKSLKELGNIAYAEIVKSTAITRYALVDINVRTMLGWSMVDPIISPLNYKFRGQFFQQFVAWVFGDRDTLPHVEEAVRDASHSQDANELTNMLNLKAEKWIEESKNRNGIEVIHVTDSAKMGS